MTAGAEAEAQWSREHCRVAPLHFALKDEPQVPHDSSGARRDLASGWGEASCGPQTRKHLGFLKPSMEACAGRSARG